MVMVKVMEMVMLEMVMVMGDDRRVVMVMGW